MKSLNVYLMEDSEFEDRVNYLYQIEDKDRQYEFVSDVEGNNYSCALYNDFKREPLDLDDLKKLDQFKAGNVPSFMARILLQDMINNKALPEGNYLIRVGW